MKRYFTKLMKPISIQILFTILYSITVALFPILNKYLFDNILQEGMVLVIRLTIMYSILILFNSMFQYISRLYEWIVSKEFNIEIKSDLFIHISSLKNNEFAKYKPADYLAIFNNNVDAIYDDYISAYIDLIKSLINIVVFAYALLFFVDYRIATIVFVLSIIVAFIPRIMQFKLSSLRKEQLASLRIYFAKVLDLLSGKKRIDSNSIDCFVEEHSLFLVDSESSRLKFGKIKTISDMLNAIGVFFIQLCTFTSVAYLLVKGEITIGTGIAAFGYVTSFLTPIRNILECINCINATKDTVEETLYYLSSETLSLNDKDSNNILIDNLKLESVSYDVENFSLKPLTFNFKKGKRYAITGHSGSGKSTLMHLIDGTIKASSGKIMLDDINLEKVDISKFIFSVDQFEYLFQTDFIKNITVFNSIEDKENLAGSLLNMLNPTTKNKISTYENITQLSGGERQILGILRMLVSNRPIILLDESFSSIDKKNSILIKNYILNLKNKIIIEVTHDTSVENLNNYDEILYFNEGRIESKKFDYEIKSKKSDVCV